MEITFKNHQRDCRVNGPLLRSMVRSLLESEFNSFQGEGCFHLVTKNRMAEVNWKFLRHEGPTDVITFDLAEDPSRTLFLAEIYLCPAVAQEQAIEFGSTWEEELIRYHIHALLHLEGYDDTTPELRETMKHEEERILNHMRDRFDFGRLARTP